MARPTLGTGASRSKLTDVVGNGRTNNVPDVLWLKNALHALGRYNDPLGERHGFIDQKLDDAITNYQRDSGLKSDGFLKPMGETEKTIRVELIRLGEE